MITICFGQQPCGFFPKRFLVSKINTARALQKELGSPDAAVGGAKIVFFYHDSDADYRETITIMRDTFTKAEVRLNFTQENKLQKKYSPLYLKRIPKDWKEEILKQLPRFVSGNHPHPASPLKPPHFRQAINGEPRQGEETAVFPLPSGEGLGEGERNLMEIFKSVNQKLVADFCLDMYRKMGLLDGIEIARSGDPKFRESALDLAGEFFADVEYQGEVVRAQMLDGKLQLHEGGGKYTQIPMPDKVEKRQKNPGRDQRFAWMQSVIRCTHYVYGDSEKEYLDTSPYPNITFVDREKIDQPGYAWLG